MLESLSTEVSGVLLADNGETSLLRELEDKDSVVATGYIVERSMGDGPEKVSLVG